MSRFVSQTVTTNYLKKKKNLKMIIRGETCYLETEEEGTPSNDGKTSPGQVWWVTAVLILWRLKQEGIDFKGSMEYIARPHFKPTNQPTNQTAIPEKPHEKPSPTSTPS